MKNLTKTLFAASMTALMLTSAIMPVFAADVKTAILSPEGQISFNKILISGNVRVIVKQGAKERVTIEGDYNQSSTQIRRKGYTLLINSSEYEPVTVIVSVKDLQRIDASGEALVKTEGKIDLKYLQVFLKDKARAIVKANTESLYTYIRDNADLKLLGATQDHTILKDKVSKLNLEGLAAVKSTADSISTENMIAVKAK